ncbi:DNA polymerase ligase N-terminal domain-containing protein [Ruania zhangjianzhongii]|uniref:DNA polymerase ligase N-terminal domain-containing protein n=1 Tax=Ruania zhangjianzhongii TaxID=2603206 RepID=UPI0011CB0175|nr:DNA polymerase ligase N-terminal domain-containing protein [Ruania zhangjianzhongii]
MAEDKLTDYRTKRSGSRTSEPSGSGTASGRRSSGKRVGTGGHADTGHQPRFVVQRHAATNLHFDFRLEIGEVLVSWAVPKGPSVNPADKRLAHRTEDHPLDYVDYEGRIEAGYGAGTVIVWDAGTFENLTERDGDRISAEESLAAGHLKVELHGEKLTGAFALTHTKMGGDEANWMLVKVDDHGADRRRKPTSTQNESVLTERTNTDLEE